MEIVEIREMAVPSLPDVPGVGFEAKADLIKLLRTLAD